MIADKTYILELGEYLEGDFNIEVTGNVVPFSRRISGLHPEQCRRSEGGYCENLIVELVKYDYIRQNNGQLKTDKKTVDITTMFSESELSKFNEMLYNEAVQQEEDNYLAEMELRAELIRDR